MIINKKKCVACANCVEVCPMGAIYIDTSINRAVINEEVCVECGTCYRGMSFEHLNPVIIRAVRRVAGWFRFRFEPEPDVCPSAAIEMNELEMPRLIRQVFSDPTVDHKSTGITGRGTEEVKTNDVTLRVDRGEVGYTIELGRPGIGVWFYEIQEMTRALAALDINFESKNPVTHLMEDHKTGGLRADILNEKIMSAIIEIKTGTEMVKEILETVRRVNLKINTVTTIGISTRCDDEGEEDVLVPILDETGVTYARAKTNMGLGRITNQIEMNIAGGK